MKTRGSGGVMVVYAYDLEEARTPWIYGVYEDYSEGWDVMEEMQNSEYYGHLTWSNNIVRYNKQGDDNECIQEH